MSSTKSDMTPTTALPSTTTSTPSKLTTNTINTLAVMRGLIGIGSMIAPIPVGSLFGLGRLSPGGALVMRLAGSRDLAAAGLLWTAKQDGTTEVEKSEVRRALWAGIAIDAMDVGSTLLLLGQGGIRGRFAGLFIAGGVGFVGMAGIGLRGI
ncbi:hypothetical protein EJ05DRAFT_487436 [Pseudovirgaria hyperparasitica]|uniref:Uncharacterized protein n=1 Tax=Pseudovirgaria hyperparasitica TaxID=470096 RepID=A0A6A6W337_9PEZI|nr:uncharacterized protein EJ05DRAFT_487436 [Pseudovirgaria hyperparasitica]KAF2756549.1 hypothetical protein EJ05DRAFT_487436 [Pseudovirgaria hyperparasitica]